MNEDQEKLMVLEEMEREEKQKEESKKEESKRNQSYDVEDNAQSAKATEENQVFEEERMFNERMHVQIQNRIAAKIAKLEEKINSGTLSKEDEKEAKQMIEKMKKDMKGLDSNYSAFAKSSVKDADYYKIINSYDALVNQNITTEEYEAFKNEAMQETINDGVYTFSNIMLAKNSSDRVKILENMTEDEKLQLLSSTINTRPKTPYKKEPLKSRFIPSIVRHLALPKMEINKEAECNKENLRQFVQEHLVSAKAKSELVLSDLAYEIDGTVIKDSKPDLASKLDKRKQEDRYGLLGLEFKLESDKEVGEADTDNERRMKVANYKRKEKWRSSTGSSRTTARKEIEYTDEKTGKERSKIYKYEYYNRKYNNKVARKAQDLDVYKDTYEKYKKETDEIKEKNPEAVIDEKKERFMSMYKSYAADLKCAQELQSVYELYNEKYPAKSFKKQRAEKTEAVYKEAGVNMPVNQTKNALRDDLNKKIKSRAAQQASYKSRDNANDKTTLNVDNEYKER